MKWPRRTAPDPSHELATPVLPPVSPESVSPEVLAWAQVVDASLLSEKTARDAEKYLRDFRRMNFNARREIAFRLRSLVEQQVSPPPPPSATSIDVIATAVSARRKQLGLG